MKQNLEVSIYCVCILLLGFVVNMPLMLSQIIAFVLAFGVAAAVSRGSDTSTDNAGLDTDLYEILPLCVCTYFTLVAIVFPCFQ